MTNENNSNSVSRDEKNILTLVIIFSIFTGFIPSLLAFLFYKDKSEYGRKITIEILNFELLLLFTGLIVTIVPFIGQLVWLVLWILNLIFLLQAKGAIDSEGEYKFPFNIQIIK